jgi:3'(2'), 5'-bisphosphate nucleotidase
MVDLSSMLQAVRQAAILTGLIQSRYIVSQETIAVNKSEIEPVTIADYGSQALICRTISQAYPDYAVIAEEDSTQFRELITAKQQQEVISIISDIIGRVTLDEMVYWLDFGRDQRGASKTWVIDPIDGTKGFIGLRNYAVAVGLLDDGIPQAGVMACPGYTGIKGGALFYADSTGAYREPLIGGPSDSIQVSQRTEPTTLIFVESVEPAHADRDLTALIRKQAGMEVATVQQLDSQEKYCLVACGDADAYLRFPHRKNVYSHRIWDHAAGVAIVQAAGGIASDLDGSKLDFSLGPTLSINKGMIIATPQIHHQLIEAANHFDI